MMRHGREKGLKQTLFPLNCQDALIARRNHLRKNVLDTTACSQYIVQESFMNKLALHMISQDLRWWWWNSMFSNGETVNG